MQECLYGRSGKLNIGIGYCVENSGCRVFEEVPCSADTCMLVAMVPLDVIYGETFWLKTCWRSSLLMVASGMNLYVCV